MPPVNECEINPKPVSLKLGEYLKRRSLVKFYHLLIPCLLQIKKSNSLPPLVLKWIDNDMSLRLYFS